MFDVIHKNETLDNRLPGQPIMLRQAYLEIPLFGGSSARPLMAKTFAYIRTSTDKQDLNNQKLEIFEFAKKNKLEGGQAGIRVNLQHKPA